MGIKQQFPTEIQKSAEVKRLRAVWSERPGDASDVIVFDGTNVLIGLQGHPQVRTESPCVPRLAEFRDVLRCFLASVLAACPGAELHFVLDGAPCEATLGSKEDERLRRHTQRIADYAEDVACFRLTCECRRGRHMLPSTATRQALISVLAKLPGEHKVFLAHSHGADLDMATALHAVLHRSQLLVSGDSDFCVFFPGVVVLPRSTVFGGSGLSFKSLSLQERLASLGLTYKEELLLVACLAGSDFHSQVMAVQDDCWSELVQRARDDAARARNDAGGGWQEVVRSLIEDERQAEAFLENFDLGAYSPTPAGDAEAWTRGGSLVYGITRVYPLSATLDPVLETFAAEMPEKSPDGNGQVHVLCPRRLLQAYADGRLSSTLLSLVRHQESQEPILLSDFLPGRPVAKCRRAALERLVAFLAGPEADSWDDDGDEREVRYLVTQVESLRDAALSVSQEPGLAVAELAKAAWEAGLETKKGVDLVARIEDQRRELLARLSAQELTHREVVGSVDLPEWVWSGALAAAGGETAEVVEARAASFFYLAFGEGAPKDSEGLVERCVGQGAAAQEQAELALLAVAHFGQRRVLPEQLRHLQRAMGVTGSLHHFPEPLATVTPQESALTLGGILRWIVGHLQDVYCLCGGDGMLFSHGLSLDGGPVVVLDGCHMHKAKDGYRVTVAGPPDEEVPEEVMKHFAELLREVACVVRRGFFFKLTSIDAVQAFSFHRRVKVFGNVPYTLKVKAFDVKRF